MATDEGRVLTKDCCAVLQVSTKLSPGERNAQSQHRQTPSQTTLLSVRPPSDAPACRVPSRPCTHEVHSGSVLTAG